MATKSVLRDVVDCEVQHFLGFALKGLNRLLRLP